MDIVPGSEGTLLSEWLVSMKDESMTIFLMNHLRALQERKMKSQTSQNQRNKNDIFWS